MTVQRRAAEVKTQERCTEQVRPYRRGVSPRKGYSERHNDEKYRTEAPRHISTAFIHIYIYTAFRYAYIQPLDIHGYSLYIYIRDQIQSN